MLTNQQNIIVNELLSIELPPKQNIQLTYHYDSGHGWVEAPKKLCHELGLTKISSCSYQDSKNYYLEQDCDAAKLSAILSRKWFNVSYIEVNDGEESFIRKLRRV